MRARGHEWLRQMSLMAREQAVRQRCLEWQISARLVQRERQSGRLCVDNFMVLALAERWSDTRVIAENSGVLAQTV